MTESNGSIGIKIQVPVLGTVAGTQSVTDVVARKPATPPVDAPAVTYKDIDGKTPVAVAAAPSVPKDNGGTKEPAAKPDPKDEPEPDKTAKTAKPPAAETGDVKADPEAEAAKLQQLAENYLGAGLKSQAIKKLEELVKKYPKTEAGKAAVLKLDSLKD